MRRWHRALELGPCAWHGAVRTWRCHAARAEILLPEPVDAGWPWALRHAHEGGTGAFAEALT